MSDYLTAITTIDSAEAARTLSRALVERRVVACINIVPNVLSVYRWKGEVEETSEHLLLMKTRADAFDSLSKALAELHPYDVPELIAVPIERGSGDYLEWVSESVQQRSSPQD